MTAWKAVALPLGHARAWRFYRGRRRGSVEWDAQIITAAPRSGGDDPPGVFPLEPGPAPPPPPAPRALPQAKGQRLAVEQLGIAPYLAAPLETARLEQAIARFVIASRGHDQVDLLQTGVDPRFQHRS